ncbi:MAG: hypothetical protein AAF756_16740 [Pseudomonadota bacterium]
MLLIPAALLLTACVSQRPGPTSSACERASFDLELLAEQQAVYVSEPRSVAGYPYLGTNRFLASLPNAQWSMQQRSAWVQRLFDAGEERRAILHRLTRDDSAVSGGSQRNLATDCETAIDRGPLLGPKWADLVSAAQVPDDYSGWWRAVGLYPVTNLPVRSGVKRLQAELYDAFTTQVGAFASQSQLAYYRLADTENTEPQSSRRDALGLRLPDDSTLEAMFSAYSPVWAIEQLGDYDKPGVPSRTIEGDLGFDDSRPSVYSYASLTQFAGAVRLQLNYLIWFEARPADGTFDILAGKLDGVHWRVTLGDDGRPLIFDSVHPCGCYHSFYPLPGIAVRASAMESPEPPLVHPLAEPLRTNPPMVLIESGSHYVRGVADATPGRNDTLQPMQLLGYESLYFSTEDSPSRLFDKRGIIRGTERLERFSLWPMGVLSPGAMRERGRHATAFLGRRHFDAGDLLDQLFYLEGAQL